MARVDALLQLHKVLMARRSDLRSKLLGDIDSLHSREGRDTADEAFDAGNEEVNCQLAELESDELAQIERALVKLKKGNYGTCESCKKKIPVGRLQALPYSAFCISCQKEMEEGHGWDMKSSNSNAGWAKISDRALGLVDSMESVNLADYES
ncbi:MAG: TraR/DksA family transcriptional regulator [Planctomycetes bacterium]|nr:TraR/DksA family transcriptional regulator [Planctomycetota bacterium]NBY02959.1 TraR/DksA family transcriptional regulator [Planctomycetota bacterium]